MDYDSIILHIIGGFSRYQRRTYFLLCLIVMFPALNQMAGVFLSARTDFRCLLPNENIENATYQLSPNVANLVYPWDNKTETWSKCERYDIDLTDQYYSSERNLSSMTSTVKCDSFVYDNATFKLTTVTEFNLVCDKAWMKTTADSLFTVGLTFGAIIFGHLSDKYGRRPILLCSIIVSFISGLLVAASPEIISNMIFRSILGICIHGMFLIAYVIAIEMVSSRSRVFAAFGLDLFSAFGYIFTAVFAYYITNWRILQTAITIPSLTFFVCWWFIPESARWLLSNGRIEEAKDLLLKESSENGIIVSRDMLDSMLNKNHRNKLILVNSSIFDLLKNPSLRQKSLLLFSNRFLISCAYLGLSWNTSSLAGNSYLNFAISGLVEIPAYLFVLFTLNRWGRKIILCCGLLLAGTSLLLTLLVPVHMPWLTILLTMIGKSAITGSYTVSSIFTAEQFPTVVRSVGVGACFTCGNIGGIIAPGINHLSTVWMPLPSVIFGSSSLLAGLAALFLPETLNKQLPDTIQEIEQSEKPEPLFFRCSHIAREHGECVNVLKNTAHENIKHTTVIVSS